MDGWMDRTDRHTLQWVEGPLKKLLRLILDQFGTTDDTVCGTFNILHRVAHWALNNQGTDEEENEIFTFL